MLSDQPLRSLLFSPALRPRPARVVATASDSTVLDFETPPVPMRSPRPGSSSPRLVDAILAIDPSQRIFVRINDSDTAWYCGDVAALRRASSACWCRLRRRRRTGRELGFDGKLCIHPSQVALANKALSSAEKIAWARKVAATTGQAAGVCVVEGADDRRPLARRPARILALAR